MKKLSNMNKFILAVSYKGGLGRDLDLLGAET